MDGGTVEWRAGGHLCICGNGDTENVNLKEKEVIVSLTHPIIITQSCF